MRPEQFDLYLVFTTDEDAALYRAFLAQQPRAQPNSTLEFGAYAGEALPAAPPRWEALYAPLVLRWPCH